VTRRLFLCAFFATAIIVVLVRLDLLATQNLVPALSSVDGSLTNRFELPYRFDGENASLSFHFKHGRFGTTRFRIQADDCITSILINKKPLAGFETPRCNYPYGEDFDFRPYLKRGDNRIEISVRNHTDVGAVVIFVSNWDSLRLLIRLSAAVVLLLLPFYLLPSQSAVLFCCLMIGTILRIAYVSVTPISLRVHDFDHHLFYIHYLVTELQLPEISAGFETHQPPLYYMLCASLYFIQRGLQLPIELFTLFQLLSLLISIGALAITLAALRVFSSFGRLELWLSGLIAASFPSAIYLASRVNNDVLLHFFAVLSLFLLFAWWKSENDRFWFAAMLAIALGTLTKLTALLLLPVACFSLLFRHRSSIRRRICVIRLGLLLYLIPTGWFFYDRIVEQGQSKIIENIDSGLERVYVGERQSFFTFNPVVLLQQPFNNPWSDDFRRYNYWEYFFRSAFFGEYYFGKNYLGLARVMLFCSLWMLPLIALGLRDRCFVLHLTLFVTLVSQAILSSLYPYSPVQDFRYVVFLVLPFVVLFVRGIQLGSPRVRVVGKFIGFNLAIFSLIWFSLLYFRPIDIQSELISSARLISLEPFRALKAF